LGGTRKGEGETFVCGRPGQKKFQRAYPLQLKKKWGGTGVRGGGNSEIREWLELLVLFQGKCVLIFLDWVLSRGPKRKTRKLILTESGKNKTKGEEEEKEERAARPIGGQRLMEQ